MIIGLSGYAQSGKDEVAKVLCTSEHLFHRFAFADPIRTSLYLLNPLVESNVRVRDLVDEYGWDVAKQNQEVRSLLQGMGAEVGRSFFGEDFWVVAAMSQLHERLSPNAVFTDVRFPNEAKAITDMGGIVVRVTRPNVKPVNAHSSEVAMDRYDFDGTIINDGTLATLAKRTLKVLDLFKQ
jgi:hypothetical protein